jgi:hypothetical protein
MVAKKVMVPQDVALRAQLLVGGGEDHGLAREIALVDGAKEYVGGVRRVRQVADLIDDQDVPLDPWWLPAGSLNVKRCRVG